MSPLACIHWADAVVPVDKNDHFPRNSRPTLKQTNKPQHDHRTLNLIRELVYGPALLYTCFVYTNGVRRACSFLGGGGRMGYHSEGCLQPTPRRTQLNAPPITPTIFPFFPYRSLWSSGYEILRAIVAVLPS